MARKRSSISINLNKLRSNDEISTHPFCTTLLPLRHHHASCSAASGWRQAEEKDIASEKPAILKKLIGYAEEAHEDCVSGTYSSKERHERDRQCKAGFKK